MFISAHSTAFSAPLNLYNSIKTFRWSKFGTKLVFRKKKNLYKADIPLKRTVFFFFFAPMVSALEGFHYIHNIQDINLFLFFQLNQFSSIRYLLETEVVCKQ